MASKGSLLRKEDTEEGMIDIAKVSLQMLVPAFAGDLAYIAMSDEQKKIYYKNAVRDFKFGPEDERMYARGRYYIYTRDYRGWTVAMGRLEGNALSGKLLELAPAEFKERWERETAAPQAEGKAKPQAKA
jgi:hypothetical protein